MTAKWEQEENISVSRESVFAEVNGEVGSLRPDGLL